MLCSPVIISILHFFTAMGKRSVFQVAFLLWTSLLLIARVFQYILFRDKTYSLEYGQLFVHQYLYVMRLDI